MWGGRTGGDGSRDLVETIIRREMERVFAEVCLSSTFYK
jgi:hypothetical protein